jgi:hypothetical protein
MQSQFTYYCATGTTVLLVILVVVPVAQSRLLVCELCELICSLPTYVYHTFDIFDASLWVRPFDDDASQLRHC